MPYHLAIPHHFVFHTTILLYDFFSCLSRIFCNFFCCSERAGIRTPDNLIKSQVLYHLSYTPMNWGSWTRTSGAGVRILCLTTWRYPIILYCLSSSLKQLVNITMQCSHLSTLFLNFFLFFKYFPYKPLFSVFFCKSFFLIFIFRLANVFFTANLKKNFSKNTICHSVINL